MTLDQARMALDKAQAIYDQAYLDHLQGRLDDESWRQAQLLWRQHRRAYERVTGERLPRESESRMAEHAYVFLVQLLTTLIMLIALLPASMTIGLFAAPVLVAAMAAFSKFLVRHIPPNPIRLYLSWPRAILGAAADMALVFGFVYALIALWSVDPVTLTLAVVVGGPAVLGVTYLHQMLVESH